MEPIKNGKKSKRLGLNLSAKYLANTFDSYFEPYFFIKKTVTTASIE